MGDIRNYDHLMASLHGVSVVYQCCSGGDPPLIGMSKDTIHDFVVKGTANVIKACRSYGIVRSRSLTITFQIGAIIKKNDWNVPMICRYLFTSSALVAVRKGEKVHDRNLSSTPLAFLAFISLSSVGTICGFSQEGAGRRQA